MLLFKLIAVCTGLFYLFRVCRTIGSETRQGWICRVTDSTRPLRYYPAVFNDLLVALAFLWLGFYQSSYLYGRAVMLWLAHIVVSFGLLSRFTDDEGRSYVWLGMPICLCFGCYFYYLALVEGVMLVDVLDVLLEILDA